MADQHTYIITIDGEDYEVNSPTELTDAQAYQAVKGQHDVEKASAGYPPLSTLTDNVATAQSKGFLHGATEGAKGLVEGVGHVVAHPIDSAVDLVGSVLGEGAATGKGLYNLVTSLKETLTGAYDAITGAVKGAPDAVSAMALKAGTDPRGWGQDVGDLTAKTAIGAALTGSAKYAPKPAAIRLGRIAETVGTEGKWPIRMMGAHQLGSGNPMGLVTMTLPETMRKGGQGLQRWATEPGALAATPESLFLQTQQEIAEARKSGNPELVKKITDRLDGMQKTLVEQQQNAKLPVDLKAAQSGQNRLDQLQAQAAGLQPAEEPAGGLSTAEMSQLAQQVPDPVKRAQVLAQLQGSPPGGLPASVARPPIRIAPETQAALDAPVAAPTPSAGPVRMPVQGNPIVGASKSRGAMSATPGFTVEDVLAVGGNPTLNYTAAPPAILERLKSARALREQSYRINAGLDKGARLASDQE